jgi:O-methyltransferase
MYTTEKDIWLEREYTPFDQGCRERFFLAATSFLFTNRAERLANGYYFEFGCHKARTMRYCWRHTRHNFNFTYVGFDSFEGLPEMGPIDSHAGWQAGSFAMGEDEFVRCVIDAGMPCERLVTVKGFYDRSLTDELTQRLLPRRASVVYVDCDLYKSTVPVLKFVLPFLQVGTIVAFDDWNCFFANPIRGQRLAWHEFRRAHPEFHFEPFYATHMLTSFVFVGQGANYSDPC